MIMSTLTVHGHGALQDSQEWPEEPIPGTPSPFKVVVDAASLIFISIFTLISFNM